MCQSKSNMYQTKKIKKRMISSYKVLPTHQKVLEGIKIPIVASVEPLADNARVINDGSVQIPHCTRCRAYLSSVCDTTDDTWTCKVCSQVMNFRKKIPKEQYSSKVTEVIEIAECQPLMHSIVCFAPLKDTIKEYLKLLPKQAPITISTFTDKLHTIPTGTVEQILSEIDTLPFPSSPVPFEQTADALISILRNTIGPVWHRVFLAIPSSETANHPLLDEFKRLYTTMARVDVYFLGMNYSPFLQTLVQAAPGLARVFAPLNESDLPAALFSDADREFAFQVMVVFRSGVAFSAQYVSSPFLASEITDNYVRIPVLPSKRAALSFLITPPTEPLPIPSQSFQCVVKFIRWNPKTNRLSHLFRIISEEYKLSSSLSELLSSIDGPLVFNYWISEIQKLPPGKMSPEINNKLKDIASIIVANPHLKSLVLMTFLAKSHQALSTAFWDRLTVGSLLSLASPRSAEAIFSYKVEAWDKDDNLIASGLTIEETHRKPNYIFLVKSFPSLFILTEEGEYTVSKGSKMDKSISEFLEECMPIPVSIIQSAFDTSREMLSVDEEEGLQPFLESIGLQSL